MHTHTHTDVTHGSCNLHSYNKLKCVCRPFKKLLCRFIVCVFTCRLEMHVLAHWKINGIFVQRQGKSCCFTAMLQFYFYNKFCKDTPYTLCTKFTCDSLVLHNNTHVSPPYLVFSCKPKCNFVIYRRAAVCVWFEKIKCCRLYLFESGNLGLIMLRYG